MIFTIWFTLYNISFVAPYMTYRDLFVPDIWGSGYPIVLLSRASFCLVFVVDVVFLLLLLLLFCSYCYEDDDDDDDDVDDDY